MKHISV
jgi:7,8-dihydropterin-6-yl-methyl-4-(beta-D-ribofuranosyl)aminobenzene 5'-phosphate synthase